MLYPTIHARKMWKESLSILKRSMACVFTVLSTDHLRAWLCGSKFCTIMFVKLLELIPLFSQVHHKVINHILCVYNCQPLTWYSTALCRKSGLAHSWKECPRHMYVTWTSVQKVATFVDSRDFAGNALITETNQSLANYIWYCTNNQHCLTACVSSKKRVDFPRDSSPWKLSSHQLDVHCKTTETPNTLYSTLHSPPRILHQTYSVLTPGWTLLPLGIEAGGRQRRAHRTKTGQSIQESAESIHITLQLECRAIINDRQFLEECIATILNKHTCFGLQRGCQHIGVVAGEQGLSRSSSINTSTCDKPSKTTVKISSRSSYTNVGTRTYSILPSPTSTLRTSNLPKISSSRNKLNSSSPSFNVCPPYSGSNTASPTLTLTDTFVPASVIRPGPTAITSPSFFFPIELSGRYTPPAVCSKEYSSILVGRYRYSQRTWPSLFGH